MRSPDSSQRRTGGPPHAVLIDPPESPHRATHQDPPICRSRPRRRVVAPSHSRRALLTRRSQSGQPTAREEYIDILYASASVVEAHVLDFDFRHLVTYFNKLSAREARELPSRSLKSNATDEKQTATAQSGSGELKANSSLNLHFPAPRKLKAILDISPKCPWAPPYLLRWLARFGAEKKKRCATPFEYEVISSAAVDNWLECDWWLEVLGPFCWDIPQGEELSKMREAVIRAKSAPPAPKGRKRRVGPHRW